MSVPFGSFPFNAAGVDPYSQPQCIQPLPLRAPTVNDIYPVGTIWCDSSVNPKVLYISAGGGVWNDFGGNSGSFTSLTVVGPTTLTGTTNINTTGAGVTTIGTGGTGATNIGNATGNTAVTGSLTASTTLTATAGAITATNGNFVGSAAGTGFQFNANAASGAAPGPCSCSRRWPWPDCRHLASGSVPGSRRPWPGVGPRSFPPAPPRPAPGPRR